MPPLELGSAKHHKVMGYEPLFERVGFGGVFRTDLLNAIADLTNHQHAQIQNSRLRFFRTILRRSDRIVDPFGLRK